jgi:hypothetical protein
MLRSEMRHGRPVFEMPSERKSWRIASLAQGRRLLAAPSKTPIN